MDWRIDATNVLNSRDLLERQHARRQPAIRSAERGEPDATRADESANEVLRCDPANTTHRGTEAPRKYLYVLGASVPLCVVIMGRGVRAAQQQQQTQQPVFRTTTRLIVQTVTVKDKDGKVIEGLTAKDFSVTEDGQPQDIAFVEFQRMQGPAPARAPAAAAARAQAAPDPRRRRRNQVERATVTQIAAPPPGDIRYQDRRLLVFYFDGSAMSPPDQIRAYTNALKYIDTQMTPADLIAIMAFQDGAVSVKTDFTDNKNTLREVIQILIYGDDQNNDGIADHPEGSAFGQNDAEFNIFNTDRQLAALQTAVSMLRPLPEQKTLLYFASGVRLSGSDNQAQLRATVNAALRANVTLNPIDARGLVATPPLGDASRASPGGIGMFTGKLAEAVVTNLQRSQDTLFALAKDTGGQAMFDYNDLSLGIVQAAQAVSDYYIVGYYSTHTDTDGKFRRVRITLERRTGGRARVSTGLLRRQGVRPLHRCRQGTAARGSVDAGQPGHRHHDRDGGELLPAQ